MQSGRCHVPVWWQRPARRSRLRGIWVSNLTVLVAQRYPEAVPAAVRVLGSADGATARVPQGAGPAALIVRAFTFKRMLAVPYWQPLLLHAIAIGNCSRPTSLSGNIRCYPLLGRRRGWSRGVPVTRMMRCWSCGRSGDRDGEPEHHADGSEPEPGSEAAVAAQRDGTATLLVALMGRDLGGDASVAAKTAAELLRREL